MQHCHTTPSSWARGRHHAPSCPTLVPPHSRLQPCSASSWPSTDAPPAAPVSNGDLLRLKCERLGTGGKGVCFQPDSAYVILTDGALPGEECTAHITAVKKGYAEAAKVCSLTPHRHAVPARCQHAGTCGGCTLQTLDYQAQLQEKQNMVLQTLSRTSQIQGLAEVMRPILGCADQFNYRNKLLMNWSNTRWNPPATLPPSTTLTDIQLLAHSQGTITQEPTLGFLRPGSFDHVMTITQCEIAPHLTTTIMHTVSRLAAALGLSPAGPDTPAAEGACMKQVVVRRAVEGWTPVAAPADPSPRLTPAPAASTNAVSSASSSAAAGAAAQGSYLVVLVTTPGAPATPLTQLATQLMAQVPQVVGVVQKSVTSKLDKAAGPAGAGKKDAGKSKRTGGGGGAGVKVLAGVSHVIEHMCGLRFRVSPDSFFQTNTAQAEVLYQVVSEAAQLGSDDVLLDLYCGTGSIGLSLAHQCKQVVGYEAVEAAVADARYNAQLNNITNATFVCGDLAQLQLAPASPGGSIGTKTTPATAAAAAAPASNKAGSSSGGGSSVAAAASISAKVKARLSGAAATTASSSNSSSTGGRVQAKSGTSSGKVEAGSSKPPASVKASAGSAAALAAQSPDVVVVNPARAGLSDAVIAYLKQCGARRVVYVSCNPATQARDLAALCNPSPAAAKGTTNNNKGSSGGKASRRPVYKVAFLQPVDLFPHTDHVENVVVLDRIGKA